MPRPRCRERVSGRVDGSASTAYPHLRYTSSSRRYPTSWHVIPISNWNLPLPIVWSTFWRKTLTSEFARDQSKTLHWWHESFPRLDGVCSPRQNILHATKCLAPQSNCGITTASFSSSLHRRIDGHSTKMAKSKSLTLAVEFWSTVVKPH